MPLGPTKYYFKKKFWLILLVIIGMIIIGGTVNYKIIHDQVFNTNKLPITTITPTPTKLSLIRLPIILYHYVEYVKDEGDFIRRGLDVTPKNFEEQLKSLKDNNYQSYFVKDIPKILDGEIEYSTKSAVLTFDDGFEDFYTDAFPLLKKYQTKATIYVIYNFIGHPNYMNKSQLQEIIGSGLVELGSHSLNHINLASVSATEARKEIFISKQKLEDTFGIKIETFSYPYGAYNNNVVELVKGASYSAAITVKQGLIISKDNLFTLPRLRTGLFTGRPMTDVFQELIKKAEKTEVIPIPQ